MTTWKVEFPCTDLNYDTERTITYYVQSNNSAGAIRKASEWLLPHLELAGNPSAVEFTPIRWHNTVQENVFIPTPTAPPDRRPSYSDDIEDTSAFNEFVFERIFGGSGGARR